MPAAKALAMHLASVGPRGEDGIRIYSGFVAALRDARRVTGRDQATGRVLEPELCGSWIGAVGYLILLDQIGGTLRPRTSASSVGGMRNALQDFAHMPRLEVDALYALRCALAHDFALLNIGPPQLTHHFALSANRVDAPVTLPTNQWNGDLDHRSTDSQTTINLWAVGDTVETIVETISEMVQSGDISVKLQGGTDELLQRYSIIERPDPGQA
jgi:hypothetical protein